MAACALLVSLVATPACGGDHGSRTADGGASARYVAPPGEVADVAGLSISRPLVVRVAAARAVAPDDALRSLIEDALAAQGAHSRGLDRVPEVAWTLVSALARRVPDAVSAEAAAQGPPVAEELGTVTAVRAAVRRSRDVSDARAAAAAEAIAKAVRSARNLDDFSARARSAPQPPLPVAVEQLEGVDARGSTLDGAHVEADVVAAAFALPAPGETSRPFRTELGWEVVRLISRAPPESGIASSPPADLVQAVMSLRVRMHVAAILLERRARTRVELSGAADELMTQAEAAAR